MKRTALILAALLCMASRHPDRMIRADLALNASFNRGDASDRSMYNHSTSFIGNASVVSGERFLTLDGTGDYLQVADSNFLSFTSGGQDQAWSFSGWIYLSALTAKQYVAIKGSEFQITIGHSAAPAQKGLTVILYNAAYTAYIGRTQNSAASIPTGQWFHIGTSYSGSEVNTGLVLYLNGSSVSSTGLSSGSYAGVSNTTASVDFGWVGYAQDASKFDDVRIYSRALSAAEVAAIYSSGRE